MAHAGERTARPATRRRPRGRDARQGAGAHVGGHADQADAAGGTVGVARAFMAKRGGGAPAARIHAGARRDRIDCALQFRPSSPPTAQPTHTRPGRGRRRPDCCTSARCGATSANRLRADPSCAGTSASGAPRSRAGPARMKRAARRRSSRGKTDRVEHGDLAGRAPTMLARTAPPQLGDGEVGRHLLDVALDAGLRLVLDEHEACAASGATRSCPGSRHRRH